MTTEQAAQLIAVLQDIERWLPWICIWIFINGCMR